MKWYFMFGLLVCNFSSFCDLSFFDDHERGWHWYEQLDDEKKGKEEDERNKENIKYPATIALKNYQAELEEAKALAILEPTSENIFNYQRKQYEMIEKSGKFAEVWMKNVYLHPEIDASLKNPTFHLAKHVYREEHQKTVERKIKELSQEYGLFFFFKNDCPYCREFAPIVRLFSDKYNWEVLAISEFGEEHELFEQSVQDNGLAEIWGVSSYPSLFAVNPKTGHVIPIANGMISIQQMEQRIMAITDEH